MPSMAVMAEMDHLELGYLQLKTVQEFFPVQHITE